MQKNKLSEIISVYADLLKYKLSLAVTFSSVTGYLIYLKSIDFSFVFMSAGVFFLASGAAVFNQYTETGFDAIMGRTMFRPLPLKRIPGKKARILAILLIITGSASLAFTGIVPVLLGLLNVLLYNVVYTKLKRVTPLAIIPGALVGAIPPLIGYEAAGGTIPGTDIILFSLFMFLWQLPHFWLILLKYHKEYEAAGFVTLSHLASEKQIRVLVFSWVFFTTVSLLIFSLTGLIFNRQISNFLIPLNIIFILLFYFLLFRKEQKEEFRGAFILVNLFNMIIMILFIINSLF
jgi:heme o synthase